MTNTDYYDGGRLVRVPGSRLSDSDSNIMRDPAGEGDDVSDREAYEDEQADIQRDFDRGF